jgi:hypothetical protein
MLEYRAAGALTVALISDAVARGSITNARPDAPTRTAGSAREDFHASREIPVDGTHAGEIAELKNWRDIDARCETHCPSVGVSAIVRPAVLSDGAGETSFASA